MLICYNDSVPKFFVIPAKAGIQNAKNKIRFPLTRE